MKEMKKDRKKITMSLKFQKGKDDGAKAIFEEKMV